MNLKKENIVELLNSVPKKSLSDLERQIIFIIIEKSKVQRESALSLMNKGFFTFFVCIAVVYWAKEKSLISSTYLDGLFGFGVLVLALSLLSYHVIVKKEEKILDKLLENYLK